MRSALLALGLPGCVVISKVPADAGCDEAISAYAIRVYECTEDAQRADDAARELRGANDCQLDKYGDKADTGSSPHPILTEDGEEIPYSEAFTCASNVQALDCEALLAGDPGGSWLVDTVAGCDVIFDGP